MGNLRITIRSSPTEERTVEVPIPSPRPLGGNTEVREFLARRTRERKAAARARRIKRTCLALGAATAVAAFVVPKFSARWRTAVAATASAPAEPMVASATPPRAPGFAITPAKELELATATPESEPVVAPEPEVVDASERRARARPRRGARGAPAE